MQTEASEAKVFLQGGLVAVDIVYCGETVFTATVPQFELWKVRAWLRERRDINNDLRLRAVQKLETIEAEIWRRAQEAGERETKRTDWMLDAMVFMHLVAVATLFGWMVFGLLAD